MQLHIAPPPPTAAVTAAATAGASFAVSCVAAALPALRWRTFFEEPAMLLGVCRHMSHLADPGDHVHVLMMSLHLFFCLLLHTQHVLCTPPVFWYSWG
jgi:hypothetical protein